MDDVLIHSQVVLDSCEVATKLFNTNFSTADMIDLLCIMPVMKSTCHGPLTIVFMNEKFSSRGDLPFITTTSMLSYLNGPAWGN